MFDDKVVYANIVCFDYFFFYFFFICPRQRIMLCERNKISNGINKQNIAHFSLKNVCVSTLGGGGGTLMFDDKFVNVTHACFDIIVLFVCLNLNSV